MTGNISLLKARLSTAAVALVVLGLVSGAAARAQVTTSRDPGPAEAAKGSARVDGAWRLRAGDSVVGYRAREQLAGLPAPRDVVGRTSVVRGSMRIEGAAIVSARVTVDMRTLTSDDGRRDRDLRTRREPLWDRYPRGSFALAGPLPVSGIRPGLVRNTLAKGTLTIRGVAREVDLPLELRWNGPTFQAVGRLPSKMTDWGFDPPSTAEISTVENDFAIELRLTFVRSKR